MRQLFSPTMQTSPPRQFSTGEQDTDSEHHNVQETFQNGQNCYKDRFASSNDHNLLEEDQEGSANHELNFDRFRKLLDKEERAKARRKRWNDKDKAAREGIYDCLKIYGRSAKTEINKEFAGLFTCHPTTPIDLSRSKFDDYNYETVMRPAIKRASWKMSKRYGPWWDYNTCEELLRIIFRNKVRRENNKEKAALKRLKLREQRKFERHAEAKEAYMDDALNSDKEDFEEREQSKL